MSHPLFNGLTLAIFLGLGSLVACSKPADVSEPERAVRTQVLVANTAGLTHEFAAEIRARIESRLSFRVGGKLLARQVNLGDAIKPGQLLAQLDMQDLLLAQESARAGLSAARTNRDQLGADFKRYIDLRDQGFISAAELERRDSAFKSAQAQLDQSRAQADAQGNQTSYASLKADVAGVVTGVEAEPGMVLAAGSTVLRVANDGPRDVVFSVPEDQLSRLRTAASQPGALTMKLWSDGPTRAPRDVTLREIAAAADPVTRTFLVKADAGLIDAKLGQTATVMLALPRQTEVIKLPLAAVLQQQGQASVWVLDAASMTVKLQPVVIGGADGNEAVIAAGLSPGLEVVVAGVHVLTPGQKVRRYQPVSMAPSVPSSVAVSAASAASR
ncbi:efflux RND transporter periplasmic adaptor subunit [Roseateles sp. GG27B]